MPRSRNGYARKRRLFCGNRFADHSMRCVEENWTQRWISWMKSTELLTAFLPSGFFVVTGLSPASHAVGMRG